MGDYDVKTGSTTLEVLPNFQIDVYNLLRLMGVGIGDKVKVTLEKEDS